MRGLSEQLVKKTKTRFREGSMRQAKVEPVPKTGGATQGRPAAKSKKKVSVVATTDVQFGHWANACRMLVF